MEGALIHGVEARFVAEKAVEGLLGGGVGVDGCHAVEAIGGRLGGDLVLEEARFHSPSAAEAPRGGGHFLDEAGLDAIVRQEAFEVIVDQFAEGLGGFVLEEDEAGEESVGEGIAGGAAFALGGYRAAGKASVGLRSENASKRRHPESRIQGEGGAGGLCC